MAIQVRVFDRFVYSLKLKGMHTPVAVFNDYNDSLRYAQTYHSTEVPRIDTLSVYTMETRYSESEKREMAEREARVNATIDAFSFGLMAQ